MSRSLQQRCVRHGLWEIEGQMVEKIGRKWVLSGPLDVKHEHPQFYALRDAKRWITLALEAQK